jgi:uncharacterized protein (TIGR02679 family)
MASSSEVDPLAKRLQQPDLCRLQERLVARLRQGRSLTGRLRFVDPSEAERRAIAALLGSTPGNSRSLSINLDVLATIATRGGRFESLQQLVEAAHGASIENQLARRSADDHAWTALWAKAINRCGDSASLRQWLSDLKTSGWIRRRTGRDVGIAARLFDDVFAVLKRLPAEPHVSLAQLAAEEFGDSHALDSTSDRGRLATRGAAALAGCERPRTTAAVRATWSNVGVVPDELSATVLALNIPALPGTPLGDILALHRRLGEPCRITFRQLRGAWDCRFDRTQDRVVHVCENPSVVSAAADAFGARCRPLISVEGQPNLAADTLLRTLHQHGFTFHYHGDFDWGGLRIAARLWRLFQFVPWRYGTSDYRAAPRGRALKGRPVDAPWDQELRNIMQARKTSVHEEAVLPMLLEDLETKR